MISPELYYNILWNIFLFPTPLHHLLLQRIGNWFLMIRSMAIIMLCSKWLNQNIPRVPQQKSHRNEMFFQCRLLKREFFEEWKFRQWPFNRWFINVYSLQWKAHGQIFGDVCTHSRYFFRIPNIRIKLFAKLLSGISSGF